ncbi:ribosomal RNA-processing protein 8 [Nematolebias whitei]|uniref:ribosomal RNA-processing protein 8 n=1 Tax=Nematolebias whitei TaxID=451745 RepID=UPI00189AD16C|nr:ribosomal RNA-processing protein 8 [Nematolebias whitei]
MFDEYEDWNDEPEANIWSQPVFTNTQKDDSSSNVKSKVVGKKSLLRTLQTLGSVPEWKNDNEMDSDRETDVTSSQSKKKKRKKKRNSGEKSKQQEGGDVQTVKEGKTVSEKKNVNKPGTLQTNSTSADETKEKNITESQVDVNKPQSAEKLSRQQWKVKMKNKRRCKNKYRQDKPEENVNKAQSVDGQEPKEETQIESRSNNSHCENNGHAEEQQKKNQHKPVKRKNTDVEMDLFTPATMKKQQKAEKRVKGGKTTTSVFGGSADGSNQEAGGLQMIRSNQQQAARKPQKPELTKEQSRKRQKLQKILLSQEKDKHEAQEERNVAQMEVEEVDQSHSDSLRSRMEQRLEAARFRYINELLYTTTSGEAKRMFRQDPQAASVYHRGYTAQVQRWPSNPVDAIISFIKKRPPSLVVADFGCGDCKIARSVKNKVHSFDLAATCELATVCDMASVPLGDGSVDIAVFCLSLMGTNLADFLAEANRVLKMGGILKIAEVASRFDSERYFITALTRLGFKMTSKDTENSHFYSFEFVKTGDAPKNVKKLGLQLKPCLYKKR